MVSTNLPEPSASSTPANNMPTSASTLPDPQISSSQPEILSALISLKTQSENTRPELESAEAHIDPAQEILADSSIKNTIGSQATTQVPIYLCKFQT